MKKKIIGIFVCMLIITTGFSFDVLAQQNNPPNKPDTPSGAVSGKAWVSYVYSSSTTDSDGDQIYYLFDWGDGNNSGWIGPYDSGDKCQESHVWVTPGSSYMIKVKAKDTSGAESPWSDSLIVEIKFSFSAIKKNIYIGLIKDKTWAYMYIQCACILVLHIQVYNGHIETEILRRGNPIFILFNVRIGIVRNHIICAIFF